MLHDLSILEKVQLLQRKKPALNRVSVFNYQKIKVVLYEYVERI